MTFNGGWLDWHPSWSLCGFLCSTWSIPVKKFLDTSGVNTLEIKIRSAYAESVALQAQHPYYIPNLYVSHWAHDDSADIMFSHYTFIWAHDDSAVIMFSHYTFIWAHDDSADIMFSHYTFIWLQRPSSSSRLSTTSPCNNLSSFLLTPLAADHCSSLLLPAI
jgi:hypothetical protein